MTTSLVRSSRVRSFLVAVISAALISGCSGAQSPDATLKQHEALKNYVEAARAEIPALLESFNGLYTDINIDLEYSETVTYDYFYADQLDPEATMESFESIKDDLQEACEDDVFPEMERAGIANPKVRFSYYNADESQIWSHTFES